MSSWGTKAKLAEVEDVADAEVERRKGARGLTEDITDVAAAKADRARGPGYSKGGGRVAQRSDGA